MIISHKHKFIFIKTMKTAGTSMEIALSSLCGKDDIITTISPEDEAIRVSLGFPKAQNYRLPFKEYSGTDWKNLFFKWQPLRFYNHIPASELKKYLSSEIWDNYYKFCFERNPFDKIVSYYFFQIKVLSNPPSFEEWLALKEYEDIQAIKRYTIDQKIVVDKIYQFEKMEEAMLDISKKLNLPATLQLPAYRAKSKFRKIKDYKKVLSPASIQLVKDQFKEEIALFNYKY